MQKFHYWLIGAVVVIGAGGAYYWWQKSITCCEPPIVDNQTDPSAPAEEKKLTGHWDYYHQGTDGYSTGVSMKLQVQGTNLSGNYDAVWSFPGAPAARLNNGTIKGMVAPGDSTVVEWEGSRDDAGQAIIRLSADGQELSWDGTLNSGVFDDGYTPAGKFIFYRNQWLDLNPTEQTQFLQTVKDLLKADGRNFTIQPGEDATIAMVKDFFVINTFVPNSPTEESGWVYLKKEAGEWRIVLGPAVRFSAAELDSKGIPEVIRY